MTRRHYPLLLLLGLILAGVAAQEPLTGYGPEASAEERALEQRLLEIPDTGRARRHSQALSAEPHVAGTPRQTWTADYVLREMASYGLDTSRVEFTVFLPYHDSTVVELVAPTRLRLELNEPMASATSSDEHTVWPAMNGFSGAGDVTAPVVYANYGLAEDYAVLDSLGVSVEGKVVIARYGRSYRGIKAREAEERGAAALLLYSDPQDDGYFRGEVYPEGPMRPPAAVQRGSINNGRGDPSTPSRPAVHDAPRLPYDSMALIRIPVVPLGYENGSVFLERLGGASVPQPWQGGLPFRYHVGGTDSVLARVAVWPERGEEAYKRIVNTIAVLRGSEFPDEVVIAGGHRDAWGPGAADNVSGIVGLLEAARALGTAAREGHPPRRTIVLATWDAEEWGLIGSVEYVERFGERLSEHAVAYLNQDVVATGREFGSSGTASLHPLVRDVTRLVRQPGDTGSVYVAWRHASETPDSLEPELGDLGGGSDFAGFYNHLGIPAFDFGFGGPYGVYHSAYDDYHYVSDIADPGFQSHAAAARLVAVFLARLANADVVPLDYDAFGRYLGSLVAASHRQADSARMSAPYADLAAAVDSLTRAGARFNAARDSALAENVSPERLAAANRALRQVERELTRPEGLVGREWMRNLIFAADRNNGYANVALPSIAEALEDGDQGRLRREVADLTARVMAAARQVNGARQALVGDGADGR